MTPFPIVTKSVSAETISLENRVSVEVDTDFTRKKPLLVMANAPVMAIC